MGKSQEHDQRNQSSIAKTIGRPIKDGRRPTPALDQSAKKDVCYQQWCGAGVNLGSRPSPPRVSSPGAASAVPIRWINQDPKSCCPQNGWPWTNRNSRSWTWPQVGLCRVGSGPSVESTRPPPEVLAAVGASWAFCARAGLSNPLLVAGTDWVWAPSLELAQAQWPATHERGNRSSGDAERRDSNTRGAEPLFFLDYSRHRQAQPRGQAAVWKGSCRTAAGKAVRPARR